MYAVRFLNGKQLASLTIAMTQCRILITVLCFFQMVSSSSSTSSTTSGSTQITGPGATRLDWTSSVRQTEPFSSVSPVRSRQSLLFAKDCHPKRPSYVSANACSILVSLGCCWNGFRELPPPWKMSRFNFAGRHSKARTMIGAHLVDPLLDYERR